MARPLWNHGALFSGQVWLVTILLLATILMAVSTGCDVAKSIVKQPQPGENVADFLQLLVNGYLREALNRMDPAVSSKYTSDGLTAINLMMDNLQEVKQTKSTVSGQQATVEVNITFKDGYAEKWVFLLALKSGEWLITEWQHPRW